MEKDMADMAVLITADAPDMVDTVPMDTGAGDTNMAQWMYAIPLCTTKKSRRTGM